MNIMESTMPLYFQDQETSVVVSQSFQVNFDMTAMEWVIVACDVLQLPAAQYVITQTNELNGTFCCSLINL